MAQTAMRGIHLFHPIEMTIQLDVIESSILEADRAWNSLPVLLALSEEGQRS